MKCPYCHYADETQAPVCPQCGALVPPSASSSLGHSEADTACFQPKPARGRLHALPPLLVFLLSLLTFNLFGIVWILKFHDAFPQRFPDQLPAGRWLLRMLVPFINAFWLYQALMELADRFDDDFQRRESPQRFPKQFIVATFILLIIPIADFLVLFLMPALCACFQMYANRLLKLRQEP